MTSSNDSIIYGLLAFLFVLVIIIGIAYYTDYEKLRKAYADLAKKHNLLTGVHNSLSGKLIKLDVVEKACANLMNENKLLSEKINKLERQRERIISDADEIIMEKIKTGERERVKIDEYLEFITSGSNSYDYRRVRFSDEEAKEYKKY